MDDRGNLYVEREDGNKEIIAAAGDLAAQLGFVGDRLNDIESTLKVKITDAPRKQVKALAAACRDQGYQVSEDFRFDESGDKYLRLRKK